MTGPLRHLRHHGRFYAAALLGLAAWLALGRQLAARAFLLGGDVFFACYLALSALTVARDTLERLRRRAAVEDEGILVIVLITLAAIGLSLGSVFALLAAKGRPSPTDLTLCFVSVPLGWLTLHTVAAFHYGHRYYARAPAAAGAEPRDRSGLAFPQTEEPLAADFLYHSFVIGMTAQVSDVQATSTAMRQLILAHSVVSFFFNAVIVALTVAAAAGQGQ